MRAFFLIIQRTKCCGMEEKTPKFFLSKIISTIANVEWPNNIIGYLNDFWIWKLPLKIKIFIWLTLNKKIPTSDFLQKIRWTRPNICHLCFRGQDSTDHIFTHCMFTRQVWDKITQDNNLKIDWIGNSITDCLDHWTTSEKFYKMLPPLVNWYIWLSRNYKIFENKNPSISAISYKALGLFHLWKDMYRDTEKKKILIKPPSTLQLPT